MYLTFDVETNSLYGSTFQVGWWATDNNGVFQGSGKLSCSLLKAENAQGERVADEWVATNIPGALEEGNCKNTTLLITSFYEMWKKWAVPTAENLKEPLYFAADCAHPCETGFLRKVWELNQDFIVYPLVEISSVLLAKGYDPVGTFGRTPEELPKHDPLNDARQSSRILHAALRGEPIE